MTSEINAVVVIGAGAMGRQIAMQCALHGMDVTLNDASAPALEDARAFAAEYLDGRVAKGRIPEEKKHDALARLRFEADLNAAVAGCSLVIEAIIEDFAIKAELFETLDRVCPPKAILATNSSNIRASRLAEVTGRAERVLNLHFFYPALVMELVEVVVHPAVSEDIIEAATGFCRAIGKTPVVMRKEIPGFIVNRIFRALTREAISLVENGYASAEDIDLAVTKGLGHPMGPLQLLDTTGIDVSYLARLDEFEETGEATARPNAMLKEMYEKGDWGKKTGKGFFDYSRDKSGESEKK